MLETLKIEYKIKGGEDKEIYRVMREAAERLGFKWYAQGFDNIKKVRDICFEKKEVKKA